MFCLPALYGRLDTQYLAEWSNYQAAQEIGHIVAHYITGHTDDATATWLRERSGWHVVSRGISHAVREE